MIRIVILDDEPQIIEGMVYIFNRYLPDFKIVATLQNPLDVMPLLMTKEVDLLFTDVKMDGMSGVQLTSEVHALFPNIYIVVLSAYSDYEFVRECLKNGAWDYLLKPAGYQIIIDLAKKVDSLVGATQETQRQTWQQKVLNDALVHNTSVPDVFFEGSKKPYLILCQLEILDESAEYANDFWSDLLLTCLDSCNRPFWFGEYLVTMIPSHLSPVEVQTGMNNGVRLFRSRGCEIHFAAMQLRECEHIGDAFASCSQMIAFYIFNQINQSAIETDYQQFLQQTNDIVISDYISGSQIAKLITAGNTKSIKQLLDEGIHRMLAVNAYLSPEKTKLRLLDEILIVIGELKNLDINPLADGYDFLSELQTIRVLPDFLDKFRSYIIKIVEYAQSMAMPAFLCASLAFIQANYMYELSLKQIADEIHMNPWYYSTQFKRYMNMGVSEYHNQIRVKNAKKLLGQGDLKISDVADMVGYKETSYFCTVFKKIVGVSPGDYQKKVILTG